MKTWIKRTLIGLGGLAVGLGAVAATGWFSAQHKRQRHIELPAHRLEVLRNASALARGQYLFNSRGCAECHGTQGQGHTVIDDGSMLVKAPSISPGTGSLVARYQTDDWERTIRHGVKPSGQPLMIMPSEDYNRMTDQDLAALIAYLESLPPQQTAPAVLQLPPPVQLLYGLGAIPDAAERIDHTLPPQSPVPEGVTVEHGRYVAQMCMGCHGEHLSGGKIPGGPPDWPAAANLTPGEGSAMPRYGQRQAFAAMLKTGRRPDGIEVSKVMPFATLKNLNDTDVNALHAYLQTLPARPAGQR